ncbi:MAG: TetR family transcriptional regulator [Proteobacteria bacterium]|nr:TetR family transcriptional regulator [Pseudomonadota bacterium]
MARTKSPDYDVRRKFILDQAAGLFAAQGFHSASISAIAKACKSSKSLIYHYFPSKDDILFAVMAEHTDLLLETARGVMAEKISAAAKLRIISRAYLDIYKSAQARHVVLLNELRSLAPARRRQIVRRERDILSIFEALIAGIGGIGGKPMARKELRTVLTRLFMGMINWTYTWYDPKGPLDSDAVSDLASEIFITGLQQGKFAFLRD